MAVDIKQAPEILRKTPTEVVTKDFEFKGEDLADGETLTGTPTFAILPVTVPALAQSGAGSSGTIAQVTFSGGLAGTRYEIVCTAVTSLSQTLQLKGRLDVADA